MSQACYRTTHVDSNKHEVCCYLRLKQFRYCNAIISSILRSIYKLNIIEAVLWIKCYIWIDKLIPLRYFAFNGVNKFNCFSKFANLHHKCDKYWFIDWIFIPLLWYPILSISHMICTRFCSDGISKCLYLVYVAFWSVIIKTVSRAPGWRGLNNSGGSG